MPETLYLIDGHNEIFRAFYAIRGGMRSPVTGEPSHAVFGFTGMLLRLLDELRPEYALVAMDASAIVFRHEWFPEYKGGRGDIPGDLDRQIPRIEAVCRAMGLTVLEQEGLEADDLIGCVVRGVLDDPACSDVRIRIVSKDKDLEQLLCDRVTMYDIQNEAELDAAGLWAKRGIRPEQVVEFLALTGDTVDNVPGVEGIGPKTAAQLIQEFGTVEGVLANLERIPGKKRENLERGADQLRLSRRLVELKCDADIPFSLEGSRVRPLDLEAVLPLFQDLGFNRYQQEALRLAGAAEAPPPVKQPEPSAPAADVRVRKAADASNVPVAGLLAVAADGEGRLAVSWGPADALILPVDAARDFLEDPARPKAVHDGKSLTHRLREASVRLRGVVFDAALAGALIDPALPTRLGYLAETYLGEAISDEVGERAEGVFRLHTAMAPRLNDLGLEALSRDVEAPLGPVVAGMEANGILCDPKILSEQKALLEERAAELREQVWAICGFQFSLDSPKQLAEALFDRLGLAAGRKNKTGRSTAAEVLEALAADEDPADPRTRVPRLVQEHRHLQKLLNTYMDQLREAIRPETGRIHCTFYQIYTSTGRMVAHNPNLQTIPIKSEVGRQIRRAFHAPPGHQLICADYSQIELRILAHASEDAGLLEAFDQGLDIHTAVAARVFQTEPERVTREQRTHAKTINYSIIYGVTPSGLARRIEGLTVAGARQLIADYGQRFPGIDEFLSRCIRDALEQGYVTTLFGRRRAIPEIQGASRTVRNLGERLAINSVIQGSGADLIKIAMVRIQRRIDEEGLPLKMLLSIHDELVFEAPDERVPELSNVVCREMEAAASLRVPLVAEAGSGVNWMDCK
jgi:DNA polymerase-1